MQRKILGIVPIKDDGETNCIDANIISIANWKKIEWRYMYVDSWKFRFETKRKELDGIWKRGILANFLFFDDQLKPFAFLKKFCGITIERKKDVDILDIYNEIYMDRPVIQFCDTYYMPWLGEFYMKEHTEHAIVIDGVDDEYVFVNDTCPLFREPERDRKIAISDFLRMKMSDTIFLNFETVNINMKELHNEIKKVDPEMFEEMEKFAEYIGLCHIEIEDVENFDGGCGILLRAIRNIIRCRNHYIWALQSVFCEKQVLDRVVSNLTKSRDNWSLVKKLLYKGYIEGNYDLYNIRIKKLIEVSTNYERCAYRNLNLLD